MESNVGLTAREIESATGGQYVGRMPAAKILIRHVAIDDRRCGEDTLFVPIVGERFDGHDFIERAVRAGAPLVLSAHRLETDQPYVLVENTLEALQNLAAKWKDLHDPFTVAVTGSAGKTTTKEMIASVLRQGRRTCCTQGNLNNQTGVPQTLFSLEPDCEAAVIEMGMNHFGEIDRLARMVRPNIGVITNIGTAHVEHLGNREGILKAKSELLAYIRHDGFALVNGDDDLLRTVSGPGTIRTFGFDRGCDYRPEEMQKLGIEGTDVVLTSRQGRSVRVRIPAPGTYMVYAALCAFACGIEAGLSDEDIVAGIAAYVPVGSRMRVVRIGGGLLLDDSYNANPSAVREALTVLSSAPGRKVAILGDMMELGAESERLHWETGRAAARTADVVIGVGSCAKHMAAAAAEDGAAAQWFSDQTQLLDALKQVCRPGDSILVKGSRAMHLEKTVNGIMELFSSAAGKDRTETNVPNEARVPERKNNTEKGSEGDC